MGISSSNPILVGVCAEQLRLSKRHPLFWIRFGSGEDQDSGLAILKV